jgi:hypothetical protein
MRRVAIAAFFVGMAVYPFSFILTMRAIAGELHGGVVMPLWYGGRTLALLAVALLAFSVVAPFFGDDRARRVWWVVPATVIAIAVTYFDLVGFGLRP